MKFRRWSFLILLLIALITSLSALGCTSPGAGQLPAASSSSQPSSAGAVPDAAQTARAYLEAWRTENYPAMYALLTSLSQDAKREGEFVEHYQGIATEAALTGVDTAIHSVLTNPDTAQVSYRVTLHSRLVGDIARDTVMNLRLERGAWRVQWDDTLVLPELAGGNYLYMVSQDYKPSRGNIYDRSGRALVGQADATAVGLYPDRIDPLQAEQLFAALESLVGLTRTQLEARFANFPQGADWYLPLGETSAEEVAQRYAELSTLSGLSLQPYKARYYYDGGVASHVLGYLGAIQPEEVAEYQRLGYGPDERVGRSGLEQWGEPYLTGQRGGALYVYDERGQPVTLLAQAQPQPASAIYTTLDRDFQLAAEAALGGLRGAIAVVERDTGRVLALVSSPGFDPNAFEPVNYHSAAQMEAILGDPNNPLLARATQGLYPLGSVFKIITMAAGIESGLFTPETNYNCGYTFTELPGAVLYDWTYAQNELDRQTQPSGLINLSQALMRSCNPYFWHVGLTLYNEGQTTRVAQLARDFGLGSPTGVAVVAEASGQIPDPDDVVDAVNMAIGQGDVLVTPLQVASFVAAVGNGGTLYRPQLVERIASPDGSQAFSFKPEARAELPLAPETLSALQEAMTGVVRSTRPYGTAWNKFTGLDVQVAGKTGTAQTAGGGPHAWFAGYTFADREGFPDIAVAVIVENAGEGSEIAAPVFRRIIELYYSGQPQTLYEWESGFNVPSTPLPQPPLTPTP